MNFDIGGSSSGIRTVSCAIVDSALSGGLSLPLADPKTMREMSYITLSLAAGFEEAARGRYGCLWAVSAIGWQLVPCQLGMDNHQHCILLGEQMHPDSGTMEAVRVSVDAAIPNTIPVEIHRC